MQEVVAGVLQQQRHAPGAGNAAAGRLEQAGGVSQQRRLAGAVSAHQRDRLPRRDAQIDAAQDRRPVAQLVPDALQLERRRAARGPRPRSSREQRAGRARGAACGSADGCGAGSRPWRRSVARACLTPAGGGARPAPAIRRAAGVCREGASAAAHARKPEGSRSQAISPRVHRDHAVGRAEAALEAMLDQQHRRLRLLVEPAQLPDQLVAGDRVELRGGLVEQHQRRAGDERRGERHALQLAAGELGGGAVEQRVDAERERHLLDAARDGSRRAPEVLDGERQLGAHGAHHDLRLGVLQQRAGDDADRRRGVLARVEAGDGHVAREAAAVEMRHEAGGGAQQRRLARAGEPGEHAELARRERQADVAQRRAGSAGVGVGDLLEAQHGHGSIPRRSANGASATSPISAASANVPSPAAIETSG